MNDLNKFYNLSLLTVLLSFTYLISSPLLINDNFIVPKTFDKSYEWRALEVNMTKVKSKTINLYWEGLGGYTHIAESFYKVMKNLQSKGKHVNMYLIGDSYSMHATSVCFSTALKWVNSDAVLFFHHVTYGRGKDKQYIDYTDPYYVVEYNNLSKCVQRGYLTNKDVEGIMKQHKAVIVTKSGQRYVVEDI